MRGARRGCGLHREELRIIPADAGSTRSSAGIGRPGEDHPRGCGEHSSEISWPSSFGGSSPRMRGARKPIQMYAKGYRIIPADAGSTTVVFMQIYGERDHPRGCGEHMFLSNYSVLVMGSSPRMRGARSLSATTCAGMGSSPRMRGAHHARLWWCWRVGIIPADAGSTLFKI